jgi:hypothetical protein
MRPEICKIRREQRTKMGKGLQEHSSDKSYAGFKSVIVAKVIGFTILQFLNIFIYIKQIWLIRVKHVLAI